MAGPFGLLDVGGFSGNSSDAASGLLSDTASGAASYAIRHLLQERWRRGEGILGRILKDGGPFGLIQR